MEISKSIFGLAKSNNGFFKSEKQGNFLISQMELLEGFIGEANSGYNSCPIFAKWDEKGITKIIKATKTGDVVMFERKVDGALTTLEIKEIKRLERKAKSLQDEISKRQLSFDSGNYNGSGDVRTYTPVMIEGFNRQQFQKKENLEILNRRMITLHYHSYPPSQG